ncbi:hypothetical protein VP01_1582g1 [Puccinia sorghi]|uniref:Uncharacterized protein n=1 Tax=Puccinia sorghi TaxID=27349 RepID=A0A0L6VHM0_9BASI|nr:hypothetical protein VP01_1582g1 [Puccinia sorghi]
MLNSSDLLTLDNKRGWLVTFLREAAISLYHWYSDYFLLAGSACIQLTFFLVKNFILLSLSNDYTFSRLSSKKRTDARKNHEELDKLFPELLITLISLYKLGILLASRSNTCVEILLSTHLHFNSISTVSHSLSSTEYSSTTSQSVSASELLGENLPWLPSSPHSSGSHLSFNANLIISIYLVSPVLVPVLAIKSKSSQLAQIFVKWDPLYIKYVLQLFPIESFSFFLFFLSICLFCFFFLTSRKLHFLLNSILNVPSSSPNMSEFTYVNQCNPRRLKGASNRREMSEKSSVFPQHLSNLVSIGGCESGPSSCGETLLSLALEKRGMNWQ